MSVQDVPTAPGALGFVQVKAALIDEIDDLRSRAVVTLPPERIDENFLFGWLCQQVADFLNEHPEHRAELLPGLAAETTETTW